MTNRALRQQQPFTKKDHTNEASIEPTENNTDRFDTTVFENVREWTQPSIRSQSPPTPEPQHNRLQSGAKSYEKIQQYTIIWRGLRREFYRAKVAGKAATRELRIPARCYNRAAGPYPPCFSGFRESSRHLYECCVRAIEEGYVGSWILNNKIRKDASFRHPTSTDILH